MVIFYIVHITIIIDCSLSREDNAYSKRYIVIYNIILILYLHVSKCNKWLTDDCSIIC